MVDPPWRMKTTMGTRDNSGWIKECYKISYDQRITVDHGDDVYDMMEQVYKARFVILPRKNRLWHEILYWPVYIKHRTTCTEWRRKMILHFRGSDYRRYLSLTWWTASWWIETLPRVKWVPTFKVECRRLGHVDDLRRQTHRRCHDTRMMFGI